MNEHILIHGGKGQETQDWIFFVSVWFDGAYLVLADSPNYGFAILEAGLAAQDWDNIPVIDEVAT